MFLPSYEYEHTGKEKYFYFVFKPIIRVAGFFLNSSMGPTIIWQEQNSIEESIPESTSATALNFV